MVSFRKHSKDEVETIKPLDKTPKTADPPKCVCGEPVATELGQTSVCVKHIKVN